MHQSPATPVEIHQKFKRGLIDRGNAGDVEKRPAIRAAFGRPKGMVAAWVLSFAAAFVAQVAGEIGGWRTGTLGEAQVLFAALGAALASVAVVVLEGLRE